MAGLAFIGSLVTFAVLGLVFWLCAEAPLAMREIALNTRKGSGSGYPLMRLLAVVLRVAAGICWCLAVLVPILIAVGSVNLS